MAYTQSTLENLRSKTGSLLKKIYTEFGLVKAELDTIGTTTGSHTTSISTINTTLAAGVKVVKVRATGAAQNAQSFAWQNPETTKIIIYKAILHVFDPETVGVGTLMDIGVSANGTTSSDTLLDGVALTSAGLFDNVTNKGTNGLPQVTVDENGGTNDYVTGTINTATGASFTGCVYLFYTKVGFLE